MKEVDILLRQAVKAAEAGDTQDFKRYLDGNPPLTDYTGLPLIYAVTNGRKEIVGLIAEKAGEKTFNFSRHVVDIACRNEDWEMVVYLVNLGAPPRLKNAIDMHFIHLHAPPTLLMLLLEYEEDEIKNQYKGQLFLLDAAAKANRADILEWGLEKAALSEEDGRLFFAQTLDNRPHLLGLLKKYGIYFEDDARYGSPLLRAIEWGNGVGVRALLELGADPNVDSPREYLAPQAADCAIAKAHLVTLKVLLDAGVDVFTQNGALLRDMRQQVAQEGIAAETLLEGAVITVERAALKMLEKRLQVQTQQVAEKYDGKDMLQAAKGGFFSGIVAQAVKEGTKLDPQDLIAISKDGRNCTILGILQLRGEQDILLDVRLWENPVEAYQQILPLIFQDNRQDFEEKVESALRKETVDKKMAALRKKANSAKFKL